MSRWAAVLAGGSGTRFWPLSTAKTPKQMLPLAGRESLLVQTVRRLVGLIDPGRTLVITARHLVGETRRMLPHLRAQNILGEPRSAGTAPALTWATHVAATSDPGATVLSLHADWFVADDAKFRAIAGRAMDVAEKNDRLVTVGIVPTRPDPGYGYIRPGKPIDGDARAVDQFIEKPDATRAAALMKEGALWNSGLFAWTGKRFDAETRAHAREVAPHVAQLASGKVDEFFSSVTPSVIDKTHFERSGSVAVVPGDFPWDDVGTWPALARVHPVDAAGNVMVGAGAAHEAGGNVVWAQEGPVVLFGVDNLVVVRANGTVLVTTREHATRLKDLLAALPPRFRDGPA